MFGINSYLVNCTMLPLYKVMNVVTHQKVNIKIRIEFPVSKICGDIYKLSKSTENPRSLTMSGRWMSCKMPTSLSRLHPGSLCSHAVRTCSIGEKLGHFCALSSKLFISSTWKPRCPATSRQLFREYKVMSSFVQISFLLA